MEEVNSTSRKVPTCPAIHFAVEHTWSTESRSLQVFFERGESELAHLNWDLI
jgi:hypothetical protein